MHFGSVERAPEHKLWRLHLFLGLVSLILLIGWSSVAAAHRAHAGLTEIERSRSNTEFEIIHRVFAHDLEPYLFGENNGVWEEQLEDVKKIGTYVEAHFALVVDGEALPTTYIGAETDGEFIFIYFTTPIPDDLPSFDVYNALLTNIKDDQLNLVNLTLDGETQSHYFQFGEQPKTFVMKTSGAD